MTMNDATEMAYRNGYAKAAIDIIEYCKELQSAADDSIKEDATEWNMVREALRKEAYKAVVDFARGQLEKNK